MKNTEFLRMQKLAGIINENQSPTTEESLKTKIREMIHTKLSEAKKDEDLPEENPEDVPTEEIPTNISSEEGSGEINVSQDAKADLSGTKGNVQDNLEAALKAAQNLGDQKLIDQIGNTITFFTRAHVIDQK
jgi:hypothetical protein